MPVHLHDTTRLSPEVLDFYRGDGPMTSDPGHAALIDALPDDIASLARVMHGLLLHQHIAPASARSSPASASPSLTSARCDKCSMPCWPMTIVR